MEAVIEEFSNFLKKQEKLREESFMKFSTAECHPIGRVRIHNPNEHRVLYVARFKKAIYVLHAFQKQTQQITLKDLKVARKAYAQIKNDAKEKSERRNVSRRL